MWSHKRRIPVVQNDNPESVCERLPQTESRFDSRCRQSKQRSEFQKLLQGLVDSGCANCRQECGQCLLTKAPGHEKMPQRAEEHVESTLAMSAEDAVGANGITSEPECPLGSVEEKGATASRRLPSSRAESVCVCVCACLCVCVSVKVCKPQNKVRRMFGLVAAKVAA